MQMLEGPATISDSGALHVVVEFNFANYCFSSCGGSQESAAELRCLIRWWQMSTKRTTSAAVKRRWLHP